jgi:hypothetical protein
MLLRQQRRANAFCLRGNGSERESGGNEQRLCDARNNQFFLPETYRGLCLGPPDLAAS